MFLTTLFKDIENAEHSTCVFFEQEYAKLHAELPTIAAIADKVLPYASMMLQTVVSAEAGAPAGAAVGAALAKAQNVLDGTNAVIYDTGATPTAASAIASVQTNLTGILAAAQIKNPASVATVTKTIGELGTLSTAISNAVAAAAAPIDPAAPPAPPHVSI